MGLQASKGKVATLVTDGVDAELLEGLQQALQQEGAMLKLVAPQVGGVTASNGAFIEADEKIDGGPSVLFDAVAILLSSEGAQKLANESTVRDFVSDAFAHLKVIAWVDAAKPLLDRAGVPAGADWGVIGLRERGDCDQFVRNCRKLRVWERAPQVKQV